VIKIYYVIGQLGKGGAERQLYELVKGISREKFEPVVISLNRGGFWKKEIQKLNIKVIELQRRKNYEFARLFKLIKIFKTEKPDIVHTYMFAANSYGRIAAIIAKTPIIFASERNEVEIGRDKKQHWIYIDKLLASFTHGIICNTHNASEYLVKNYSYDNEKVFAVHNGINIRSFLVENDLNQQIKLAEKVVGTVGRLYPQKNHKLFLDMAKIILNIYDSKNIKFIIIGDGPLRDELEKYSRDLELGDNIVFIGERNDIRDQLQRMDVFAMTSSFEGLSNAIMEAMGSGLPVVATDVGGNSELVINGETGFLCPSTDDMAFAEKVIRLIDNKKEAEEMGKNGKKRILNEFGVEKMIRETEKVYLKILEIKNKRIF
jgi:glycosyltransferase involved in cell wall biosynthesis